MKFFYKKLEQQIFQVLNQDQEKNIVKLLFLVFISLFFGKNEKKEKHHMHFFYGTIVH